MKVCIRKNDWPKNGSIEQTPYGQQIYVIYMCGNCFSVKSCGQSETP